MNTAVFGQVYKFKGLSTETKPDCNSKGSVFEETDTGKTYRFDGTAWVEVEEDSGGGAFFVTFTFDDSSGEEVYSADKTFAEVAAAIDAGKMVFGIYSAGGVDSYYLNMAVYGPETSVVFRDLSLGEDGLLEQFTLTISKNDTVTREYLDCDLSTLIVES